MEAIAAALKDWEGRFVGHTLFLRQELAGRDVGDARRPNGVVKPLLEHCRNAQDDCRLR